MWGVAGLVVTALLLGFGIRTPMVMGRLIGPQVASLAEARGIDLQVATIGGVGWTGIRFYEVEVGVGFEGARLWGEFARVDVYPDVWGSMKAGGPLVKRVVVDGGGVELARGASRSDGRSGEPQRDGAVESGEAAKSQGWLSKEMMVELRDVEVDVEGIAQRGRIDEAQVMMSAGEENIEGLEARGEFMGYPLGARLEEERLVVDVRGVEWEKLSGALPVELSLEEIAMSRGAAEAMLRTGSWRGRSLALYGLRLGASGFDDVVLQTAGSTLDLEAERLRWRAADAELTLGSDTLEMVNLELAYRRDVEGFSFQAEVGDDNEGRAEVEGQWHLPTSLVTLNAWLHDFSWDGSIPGLADAASPVEDVTVSGAFHGDVDLIHQLVSLDGRFQLRELAVELPIVANQRLVFEEVEVAVPLTVDLRGRAVSVAGGEVSFGELLPLGFHGYVVDAGSSYSFRLAMHGEEIDAARVTESLPEALLGAVTETQMSGLFGILVTAEGHTADPESLLLEVNFSGEVDVHDEPIWEELEGRLFHSKTHPARRLDREDWTSLDGLPAHVSAAILSAEDATFFQHDGLDWTGLRMAMVQNLREGALVRGGSTISQQVAKNLFLTQDRTLSRKLQEAFLTWRIETVLSKGEILELYLNVAQWGRRLHGIGAAAAHYFQKEAAELTLLEAAALGAILPSPARFGGALSQGVLPTSREAKMRRILVNMRFLEQLGWPDYYAAVAELDGARIGGLTVEFCGDEEEAPAELMGCEEIEARAEEAEPGSTRWEVADHREAAGWEPLTH